MLLTYRFHSWLVLLVLFLAVAQWVNAKHCSPGTDMEVVFQWRFIDFLWPSRRAREEAIENNEYVPENVTIYDFGVYKGKYYVSLPRIKYGVPVTLATISDKKRDGQYLLEPFPNWKANRLGNCHGLTSVYSFTIDAFGRLWALDSGTVDIRNGVPNRVCQPKVLVYDLTAEDQLVASYPIPDQVLDCNSLPIRIITDIRHGNKRDVFAYISDVYGFHLIVFNVRKNTFHRVTQPSFLPNPHYVDRYIAGTRVFYADGLFSLALGPVCNNDRRLYYHAISSVEECWVMASTIRDDAYVTNERAYPDSFYCYRKKRDSQSAPELIAGDVMLFQQDSFNAIACWNTELDYNMENTAIVARNDTTMQGITSLSLVDDTELYAVSNRFQLFEYGLLSGKEINFRILKASVEDLICGTPCVKPCPKNKTAYRSQYED